MLMFRKTNAKTMEKIPLKGSPCPLQLWFLNQLKERKVQKIYETVNDIHAICSEMPILGSSIKAMEPQGVKFNRQGKFRYWFKELHRVSMKPDNHLSLEQLWCKVLRYTQSSVKELDKTFFRASKSSFSVSEHFIGLLKNDLLHVNYNPNYALERLHLSCDVSKFCNINDFSWSKTCQSTVSLITKKQNIIRQLNVFSGEVSYETCSATSLCCVRDSEYDPNSLMTSGHYLTLWDVRQEGPALKSSDVLSPCLRLGKQPCKSTCFVQRDEFYCVLASKEGCLNLLDKRNMSEAVSSVDTRFRNIFSVELNRNKQSILLQSADGVVKICHKTTLKSLESGFCSHTRTYPICGQTFGDDNFVQYSEKFSLFCDLFRLPVLNIELPWNSRILSCAFSTGNKKLFCSGVLNSYLISFH
jgi:hypothetical protein